MTMRILCLDVGEKRIGLAVSDGLGLTGQPLPTLIRKNLKADLAALKKIISEQNISEIVVGWPLNLNGSESPQTKYVSDFIEILKSNFNLPLKIWDERLTSLMVERTLIEADMSRQKRRNLVDKLSAQVILQGYLDSLKKKDENKNVS